MSGGGVNPSEHVDRPGWRRRIGPAIGDRDIIDAADHADLKMAAKTLLALAAAEISGLVALGTLRRWLVAEMAKQAKTYRSEIAACVHEMMKGVYEAGLIDKQTMRAFDRSCLATAEPMSPEAIRAIRNRSRFRSRYARGT
nr:hypothetical protein [uncultured Rhodopila sp.]